MTFRSDINGLRAIAVILVIFFHFQVPGFSAGFIGVDIFFVISGFLMTSILYRGLENNFSKGYTTLLWSFYIGRARRILPALSVLVVVLLVIGWWTLGPGDYERLAKHALSSLFFVSNYDYYLESGYFDVDSYEKWLLHTWSLSLEWQFYLILPLLLVLVWKLKPNLTLLIIVISVIALVSFVYGILSTNENPEAAFYLLPSRMWELLAGALVYLLSTRLTINSKFATFLEIIGLALIVLTLFIIRPVTPWPGLAAIFPITGTALVLIGGNQNSRWAMLKFIQWIGKISYSLYLYHWPLVVTLIFLDLNTEPLAVVISIAISLILAGLSYIYVEQLSRKSLLHLGPQKTIKSIIISLATMTSVTIFIFTFNGFPHRMPDRFNQIMAETKNINPHRKACHGHPEMKRFPWCVIGGDNLKAVIFGDSHASNIVTTVLQATKKNSEDGVIMSTYTSCPPILNIKKRNSRIKCAEFNDFVSNKLKTIPKDVPLIISAQMSYYIFGNHLSHHKNFGVPSVYFGELPVSEVTDRFLINVQKKMIHSACHWAKKRPTYWLAPWPEFPSDVPRRMARKYLLSGKTEIKINRSEYIRRNEFVSNTLRIAANQCKNFNFIDVTDLFCDNKYCYGNREDVPLYYDSHHLSNTGSLVLLSMFETMKKNF